MTNKSLGLTVTDLNQAIAWYREVFDFEVIHDPVESVADGSYYAFSDRTSRSFALFI